MKKFFRFLFGRFTIFAFLIIAQVVAFALVVSYFGTHVVAVQIVVSCLAALMLFAVSGRDIPVESKLSWTVFILLLPVPGTICYAIFSRNRLPRRQHKLIEELKNDSGAYLGKQGEDVTLGLTDEQKGQLKYINNATGQIGYTGNALKFYPSGREFFGDFLQDLKAAKEFIFLEYFIIDDGQMLDSVMSVLYQKAEEGLDVRLIYDDIGTIGKISSMFARRTRKRSAIKCYRVNKFVPVVSAVHNNRDHRKIAVIDGRAAYTGGINVADEYIGVIRPYGEWKDSAVRIAGPAVDAMTVQFLSLYCLNLKKKEDFSPFLNKPHDTVSNGVAVPYSDGPQPYYDGYVGENVFINVINSAKKYLWITTPYFICDGKIMGALGNAAMRGVDVRIILPHVPDKKIILAIGRSNYRRLQKDGVKFYEFTPGFMHAKQLICDGETAIVGTINFDYRSLLHHFENGVLFFNADIIEDIKSDFEATFPRCENMENFRQNFIVRGFCRLVGVFQPLL